MGTLSVDKLVKTSSGAAEFTLPATDGAAGTVLQTDGSGQLSVAALAADTVTATQIAANAVTSSEIADDAVTIAKLAATGTASATTFLRGDNSWAALGDNTPSFAAYNPADQSLTSGAYNKMTATTEVYDTGSCYDAANAKFTVPAGEAGKYVVWTRSSVSTGGTSALIHQLGNWMYLNGSASEKIYWGTPANSTVSAAQTFMGVFDLSAADYVEWYIWVSFSSGTITTSSGPAYSQWGAFKLAGV